MRYLGLDLGSRTLGVSISDKTGLIANTYTVIRHNEEYDKLIDEVKNIVKLESIDRIVLGYPKNMNGSIGEKAKLSEEFKKKLEDNIGIEVILEDERMTSQIANSILLEGDISRKKRKGKVDKVAATIILQSYLDRRG